MRHSDILVVGAGMAGLMAAITSAQPLLKKERPIVSQSKLGKSR